jgi:hypothetical protein
MIEVVSERGYPETWIVDPQGVIVERIPQQVTADALSQELQKLREGDLGQGSTA